ncbi:MAG: L,D-transpeptidase family protein [Methyloligellaceae bacterium]
MVSRRTSMTPGVRRGSRAVWPAAALLVVVALSLHRPAAAQSLQEGVPAQIEALLQAEESFPLPVQRVRTALTRYYVDDKKPLLWLATGRMDGLLARMKQAATDGLKSGDYPVAHLEELKVAAASTDARSRAVIELWFSAFFLKYASDLKVGRFVPRKIDPELYWQSKVIDEAAALTRLGGYDDPRRFYDDWQPQNPDYLALRQALAVYSKIAADGGWPRLPPGEVLKPGMSDPRVPQLKARLAVTGEFASAPQSGEPELYEGTVVDAVKRFQRRHGLDPDGVIGTRTLIALNIPVEQRLRQIVLSMERWRWMPEDLGAHYVLVNIAGFQLRRIEQGKLKETMRVIVGKPYRRTPVFSDTMKYVEINPFWTVPYSIATRDKLPVLQKNPASLVGSGFEAFNGSRKISMTAVDWSRYSRGNFPFTLRQKPGPKNALGRVKFMFPNKFNVYLHDTPQRGLFEKTTRAFSSGCIRLHRPIDLADQVLSQESG